LTVSVDCLRQSIRLRRRQLGLGVRYRAAADLAAQVSASTVYQKCRYLALYLANDGELNCHHLMKQAWKDGKECYLPVLSPRHSAGPMMFARYHPGSRLVKNSYGILEPVNTQKRSAELLDLVIMPLVAFDKAGHRIGMGGGYYDRSFAFRQNVNNYSSHYLGQSPYLMGVAYRLQEVSSIKAESWDIKPDQVLVV